MAGAELERIGRAAQAALPRWGASPAAKATLINHSENATYRVDDPDGLGTTILRVHRPGYHSEAAIRSELQWLEALRGEAGVVTAPPIPARDGNPVQLLGDAGLDRPRFAVMFAFLDGTEPPEDALLAPFGRLGEVTARLHAHARGWRRPAGFVRQTWDFDTMLGGRPIWGSWRDGMGVEGERALVLQRLARRIEARLAAYGRDPARFGLVHADLRLANLLVDDRATRVIDFDDCGFSWFMYDFGAAVSFIEDRPDMPELIEAWAQGYRRAAPLSAADEAEIPTFVMLRRLLLVAWVGSHAETSLAQSLGVAYTEGSCTLAEQYLGRFG